MRRAVLMKTCDIASQKMLIALLARNRSSLQVPNSSLDAGSNMLGFDIAKSQACPASELRT
ncbi:hypothetical protein XI01_16180 [Bradyrhizobium sp. CCBAU 21360]|nr:hypothetical protein [Bradyrhizobium sp. CCBAU 21360]